MFRVRVCSVGDTHVCLLSNSWVTVHTRRRRLVSVWAAFSDIESRRVLMFCLNVCVMFEVEDVLQHPLEQKQVLPA